MNDFVHTPYRTVPQGEMLVLESDGQSIQVVPQGYVATLEMFSRGTLLKFDQSKVDLIEGGCRVPSGKLFIWSFANSAVGHTVLILPSGAIVPLQLIAAGRVVNGASIKEIEHACR